MSHRRPRRHEAALRELVEEARRSGESRSAARRHRLVPAFYLKRWADDGKLRVTNVDEGKVLGHDTEERRDRDGLLPSCAVLRGQGCTLREITPERYHLTFKAFYADEGRIPVRPV